MWPNDKVKVNYETYEKVYTNYAMQLCIISYVGYKLFS